MTYALVVFDCDGVMFQSRAANEAFYNHIKARFGLGPLTEAEIDYVHRATAKESVDHIVPPELREKAQAFRLSVDYTPFIDKMIVEPDLVETLEKLNRGRKTAVFTNRSDTIGPLLKTFDLTRLFGMVVSSLDVKKPKPDPEGLHLIMNELGFSPAETLFIGDSTSDADAAQAAGVDLAAFRNPGLEARHHIDRLSEVPGLRP